MSPSLSARDTYRQSDSLSLPMLSLSPLPLLLLALLQIRNILLRDGGDLSSVVLIDFGLSRCLPDAAREALSSTDTCADEEQRRTIQAMACSPRCGTVQYMSPEMLTMNCSDTSTSSSTTMSMSASDMQATDVWSLGVVLYVRNSTSQCVNVAFLK